MSNSLLASSKFIYLRGGTQFRYEKSKKPIFSIDMWKKWGPFLESIKTPWGWSLAIFVKKWIFNFHGVMTQICEYCFNFVFLCFMFTIPCSLHVPEFRGLGEQWSFPWMELKFTNSKNLINHWNMKCSLFKDLCLAGVLIASRSLTLEVTGSDPLTVMTNILVTEFNEKN